MLVAAAMLFCAGFAWSVSVHGDWILARSNGQCVAFDPEIGKPVGSWPPAPDGRCHMSSFIWGYL